MDNDRALEGTDLIECVQSNAKLGLITVVRQCGYGEDVESFTRNLQSACEKIGIKIESFQHFLRNKQIDSLSKGAGLNIAPDSSAHL